MDAPVVQPPPPPPIQPVPPPPPKKNYSGILIGVLLLLLGILVGLALSKTTILSNLRIPYLGAKPTPLASPKPTAETGDPTADWKTYTNSASFYTLKYPTTWRVIERKQLLVAGPFIVSDTEWNLSTANDIPNIKIIVYKSDSDFAKSIASGGTKVVVVGKTATKNTTEEPTFTISYVFTNSAYTYFISLETASKQESSQYEPLFNQILSTFKFVEQTQVDTTNWKTYTNDKFGFSVQYPPTAKTTSRDPDPFPVAIQIDNLQPRTGGGGGPLMEGWLIIISEPQIKETTQTLNQWATSKHLTYVSDPNTGKDIKQEVNQISIGQKSTISWTGPEAYQYYVVEKDAQHVMFIMINMGDISSGVSPIFNQILSTFKFTQ